MLSSLDTISLDDYAMLYNKFYQHFYLIRDYFHLLVDKSLGYAGWKRIVNRINNTDEYISTNNSYSSLSQKILYCCRMHKNNSQICPTDSIIPYTAAIINLFQYYKILKAEMGNSGATSQSQVTGEKISSTSGLHQNSQPIETIKSKMNRVEFLSGSDELTA